MCNQLFRHAQTSGGVLAARLAQQMCTHAPATSGLFGREERHRAFRSVTSATRSNTTRLQPTTRALLRGVPNLAVKFPRRTSPLRLLHSSCIFLSLSADRALQFPPLHPATQRWSLFHLCRCRGVKIFVAPKGRGCGSKILVCNLPFCGRTPSKAPAFRTALQTWASDTATAVS